MTRRWRIAAGFLLVVGAMATFLFAVSKLRFHDYIAAAVLIFAGFATLQAGAVLLGPCIGE